MLSAEQKQIVQGRAKHFAVIVMGAVLLFAIYLYISHGSLFDEPIPIMAFVLVSATLGSLVNESGRPVPLDERPKPGLWNETLYFVWKVLVALVFACLLYLVFMSGMIEGPLFPRFQKMQSRDGPGGAYTDMLSFMKNCKPADNSDAAKVLVWSFMAGYAERLVPNLMRRFSEVEPVGNASGERREE